MENSRLKLFCSKKAAAAAAGLAFAASLVGLPATASAAARLTIQSGGMARHAVVVLRDRLKLRRRPLIIVLHRGGGLGARVRRGLGLEEAAASNGPIFLYPDAIKGDWPTQAGPDASRDIKFLHDLVQHFINQGEVNPRRIFLVGVSSGGAFAYRAACAGIGRPLAGLATLIAAMPADLASCAPPAPLAYVAISGQSDHSIPYAGGEATLAGAKFKVLPAEDALAIFAKADGCGAKATEKAIPDRDKRDHSRAFIQSYSGCKAPVELVRVEGGGHRIPGRNTAGLKDEASGGANYDFDASYLIWDFMKRSGA